MKRIPMAIQLSLILFIVLVIPCVLLTTYSSYIIADSSNREIAEASLQNIEAARRLTEAVTQNLSNSVHRLAANLDFSVFTGLERYANIRGNYQNGLHVAKLQQELAALVRNESTIHSAFFLLDGADYVISSDRGVVQLDSYPSTGWLRTASQEKHGVGGVWVPRVLDTATPRNIQTGAAAESRVNVLSYVYSLSRLTTSTNGTIVINVRERDIFQSLNPNDAQDSRYGTMLLRQDGKVISHPDASNFLIQARNLSHIPAILDEGGASGYDFYEAGGKRFLYTYLKTSYHDWIYIAVHPMDEISGRNEDVLRNVALFTVVMVLGSTIIAVLVSAYISRPMRSLMKSLRESGGMKEVDAKNELAFLYDAFQKIQAEEKDLNRLLQRHEKDVLALALRHLLAGEPPQGDAEDLLRQTFPHQLFIIAIIAVDNYAQYRSRTNSELRRYHRLLVSSRSEEILAPELIACGVGQAEGRIALIINLASEDGGEPESGVPDDRLQRILTAAAEVFGSTVTIGVSRVVAGYEGIYTGLMQANGAVTRRMKSGGGRVIRWKPEPASRKYFYPQNCESRILNYLDMGDIGLLSAELGGLRESLLKSEEITYDNIRYIYSQLVGATIRHLSENDVNTARLFSNRGNVYTAISSFDTLDEIQAYLEEFYRDIVEYRNRDVPGDKQHLSRALRYIEEHYREDIDFESMAADIGISYSHMRRVVRDATGKSLIDHLNRRRIQQAKQMLAETDAEVNRIAQDVGYHNVQSLNRFFRKFEGVTPSEYRSNIRQD